MLSGLASREEFALFNPPFLAASLFEAAAGFRSETDDDMPIPLAFVATTIAGLPHLRTALPRTVRTHHAVWLTGNPWIRPELSRLFPSLVVPLRAALVVGARNETVELHAWSIRAVARPSRTGLGLSDDTKSILSASRFLGRWYGRSGSPATVLSLLGFSA